MLFTHYLSPRHDEFVEQAYKSVDEVINNDTRMSLSDIIDLLNGIKDLKLYNVKRE